MRNVLNTIKGLFTKGTKINAMDLVIAQQQAQINDLLNAIKGTKDRADELVDGVRQELNSTKNELETVNKFFNVSKEILKDNDIEINNRVVKEYLNKSEVASEICVDTTFVPFTKAPVVNTNITVTGDSQIADDYENEVNRQGWDKTANFNLSDMQGLSLANRDDVVVIYALVDELRSKIYNTKIDDIFEAMEGFPDVVLQQYVLTLQIADNSYQTEFSNLESINRKDLVETIAQFQLEGFQKVMATRGFDNIKPSEKQLKLLNDNGIDSSRVLTRFKASELINAIMEEKGSNPPSAKQKEYLMQLVEKTGFAGYEELDMTTAYKTSQEINKLQKIADEKFGDNPLTQEQKIYYANLLKRCNKRLTKQAKEEMNALTQLTFKEKVKELKELELKVNPYLTEGQLNYIISLHDKLRITYNMDDLKIISRAQATKVIENLNRDLLFQSSRLSAKQWTKEEIKTMSIDNVKEELKRLEAERKERYTA